MPQTLRILGTRGIPARHGGFETFAEDLALYLSARGWEITVYCQGSGHEQPRTESWRDIQLVHIPVKAGGAKGTIVFDWKATRHAAAAGGPVLTLGYNTAIFCAWYRLARVKNLINMDGVEWRRDKYGLGAKAWLWINEACGAWFGDHLIADHPEIKQHLQRWTSADRITTIPYGSRPVNGASAELLDGLGLAPREYALVIARPEPENSLLPIVEGFSSRKRKCRLVILGEYSDENSYHRRVKGAASDQVIFPGALYEKELVEALRFHARLYVHGHTVGGTNPSLVEALGAGNAVLAHDNPFNRWVAGNGACYFRSTVEIGEAFDRILEDDDLLAKMGQASRERHQQQFLLDDCLRQYEVLLSAW